MFCQHIKICLGDVWLNDVKSQDVWSKCRYLKSDINSEYNKELG